MTDGAIPPWEMGEDPSVGTALPRLLGTIPGPEGRSWIDRLAEVECPAIIARRARRQEVSGQRQDPIVWERARGSNVWDPDGNRFVDLLGGFGVASAGHGNPAVRDAVSAQMELLVHGLGDAFPGRPRIELSEALARLCPGDLQQSIFCSSGSEAVEAALKTAMIATGRSGVLAFENGYHGMSLGALSVSHYKADFRQPFTGRLGIAAEFLPFGGGPMDLRSLLDRGEDRPAAVLVEPVQGRGGNRCAPKGWFGDLKQVCDAAGVLLIFDEIFTGFGRTGSLFAAGTEVVDGVIPDLLCLGKGMSSGFPISACVGSSKVMAAWGMSRGEALHTSTFLGHPVGCAAALAVIGLIENGGLVQRAHQLGLQMGSDLAALAAAYPRRFGAVRGRGAMRGLEVRSEKGGAVASWSLKLCRAMLRRGYLILPAGPDGEVLSFTPPLILTSRQWAGALEALRRSVEEVFGGG